MHLQLLVDPYTLHMLIHAHVYRSSYMYNISPESSSQDMIHMSNATIGKCQVCAGQTNYALVRNRYMYMHIGMYSLFSLHTYNKPFSKKQAFSVLYQYSVICVEMLVIHM